MAIPPVKQPPRIIRTGTEFTLGRGAFTPEHGPIQDLGNPALKRPTGPILLASDESTTKFTIASGAAGTSQSFTAMVPFFALPGFAPDVTDLLFLKAIGKASLTGGNVTISQDSTVGQARASTGKITSGPTFPGGFTYLAWSARYDVTVILVTALASSLVMPVKIDATLLLYSPKTLFGGNVATQSGSGVPIGSGTGGSGTVQGGDFGGTGHPGGSGGRRPL